MPKANRKFQTRDFNFKLHEVVDENDQGLVNGYASTFGNLDQGLDIVRSGAFSETIKATGGKVPILADHNPTKQIGWNLSAVEDNIGLFVNGDLDIRNNSRARERFSLVKKALEIGAKAGLSIGFFIINDEPDPENPRIRILTELKLVEYSFVTFPMNVEAMATIAKSWMNGKADANLDEHVDWFYKHMEQIGFNHTDVREQLKSYSPGNPSNDPTILIQSLDDAINLIKS